MKKPTIVLKRNGEEAHLTGRRFIMQSMLQIKKLTQSTS